MSNYLKTLLKEISEQLGDHQFFTASELAKIGFFGTTYAARKAIKEGKLPFIRISNRRKVIPRPALLEYLRNNISEKSR